MMPHAEIAVSVERLHMTSGLGSALRFTGPRQQLVEATVSVSCALALVLAPVLIGPLFVLEQVLR